jgi:hypothetical protein
MTGLRFANSVTLLSEIWLKVSWCGEYLSGAKWKALALKKGCLKSPMALINQLSKSYIPDLYKVNKDEYMK